jgi:type VI secretion system secreted protein Hcp
MAVDYYLKLDGINGESTDDKHQNWIEVKHCNVGATQAATWRSGSGGGGAGKVEISELSIAKTTDSSSPVLFVNCASGKHIASAYLECCRAGGDKQNFFKITLTDVLVSGIQFSGSSGSDLVDEHLSLSFG